MWIQGHIQHNGENIQGCFTFYWCKYSKPKVGLCWAGWSMPTISANESWSEGTRSSRPALSVWGHPELHETAETKPNKQTKQKQLLCASYLLSNCLHHVLCLIVISNHNNRMVYINFPAQQMRKQVYRLSNLFTAIQLGRPQVACREVSNRLWTRLGHPLTSSNSHKRRIANRRSLSLF